jgi:hypothetical protein
MGFGALLKIFLSVTAKVLENGSHAVFELENSSHAVFEKCFVGHSRPTDFL